MKFQWIPSTTLSIVRSTRLSAGPVAGVLPPSNKPASSLSQPLSDIFTSQSTAISERLLSASVTESDFWNCLTDELVSIDADAKLTASLCEVALLRAGGSQLQSDQNAALIHRHLETAINACLTETPRLADQLRLRFQPLQQALEAFGPGLLRTIGKTIWNGAPPKNWWPPRNHIHAVQPVQGGAAARSSQTENVWIEAMLTDATPEVPEWLRLAYEMIMISVDSQTKTQAFDDSNLEFPWAIGIIPLILQTAAEQGGAGTPDPNDLPIGLALEMWLGKPYGSTGVSTAILQREASQWWQSVDLKEVPFPIALKQLGSQIGQHVDNSESMSVAPLKRNPEPRKGRDN